MSEHTRGPWRVGKGFGSVVADTPVPEVNGSDAVEYYGGHLVAESISPANARLIAAAPDLLAALKACLPYAMQALNDIGGMDEYNAVTNAEKAIARATGAKP